MSATAARLLRKVDGVTKRAVEGVNVLAGVAHREKGYHVTVYPLSEVGPDKFSGSKAASSSAENRHAYEVAKSICMNEGEGAAIRAALGDALGIYVRTKLPESKIVSVPVPYSDGAMRQAHKGSDAGFTLRVSSGVGKGRPIQVGGKTFRAILTGVNKQGYSADSAAHARLLLSALTPCGNVHARASTLKQLHKVAHKNSQRASDGDLIGARTYMAGAGVPEGTSLRDIVTVQKRKDGSGMALALRPELPVLRGSAARGIRLSRARSAADCANLKNRQVSYSSGVYGSKTQFDRARGACKSPGNRVPLLSNKYTSEDKLLRAAVGSSGQRRVADAAEAQMHLEDAAYARRQRRLAGDDDALMRLSERHDAAVDRATARLAALRLGSGEERMVPPRAARPALRRGSDFGVDGGVVERKGDEDEIGAVVPYGRRGGAGAGVLTRTPMILPPPVFTDREQREISQMPGTVSVPVLRFLKESGIDITGWARAQPKKKKRMTGDRVKQDETGQWVLA